MDLILGIATLTVTMSGTLHLIAGLQKQRTQTQQSFVATEHLANLAETLDAVNLDAARAIANNPTDHLPDLPNAKLTIELDAPTKGTEANRYRLTSNLVWGASVRPQHNTLTIWKTTSATAPIGSRDSESTGSKPTNTGSIEIGSANVSSTKIGTTRGPHELSNEGEK